MENIVDSFTSPMTVIEFANIPMNKPETAPPLLAYETPNFIKITQVAGSKIIQAYHVLIERKQRLQEITAYEPGNTSNQPSAALPRNMRL